MTGRRRWAALACVVVLAGCGSPGQPTGAGARTPSGTPRGVATSLPRGQVPTADHRTVPNRSSSSAPPASPKSSPVTPSGGSSSQERGNFFYDSTGTASLETGGQTTDWDFPSLFGNGHQSGRGVVMYSINSVEAERPNFALFFEVDPSTGDLKMFGISRPTQKDGGFISFSFIPEKAMPWLKGTGTLTGDSIQDRYRFTIGRPRQGTWLFDISPKAGANIPPGNILNGRMSIVSGVTGLPNRWSSLTVDIDFRSSIDRFRLHRDFTARSN